MDVQFSKIRTAYGVPWRDSLPLSRHTPIISFAYSPITILLHGAVRPCRTTRPVAADRKKKKTWKRKNKNADRGVRIRTTRGVGVVPPVPAIRSRFLFRFQFRWDEENEEGFIIDGRDDIVVVVIFVVAVVVAGREWPSMI